MSKENPEYEAFVEKFKPKLTTDDCYTPPEVYDVVLNYVKEKCDIAGCEVVRPFYPGGDYENFDYPESCVVIDNPPFSIFSQIIRFYNARNIKYFLFGPHLTIFGSNQDYTAIITDASIIYQNGAVIKTAFVSNLFGTAKIIGCHELHSKLKAIRDAQKANLPKYDYPANIVTVSSVAQQVLRGQSFIIDKKDVSFCRGLDSQKKVKKGMFGSGFFMSDKATKKFQNLKEIAMNTEKKVTQVNKIIWELSDREREIIKSLG